MTLYIILTSEHAVSRRNAAVAAVRLVALVPEEFRPRIVTAGPDIVLAITIPANLAADDVMAAMRLAVCDPALNRWRLGPHSQAPPPLSTGDDEE
jgi:hypothetical protein